MFKTNILPVSFQLVTKCYQFNLYASILRLLRVLKVLVSND